METLSSTDPHPVDHVTFIADDPELTFNPVDDDAGSSVRLDKESVAPLCDESGCEIGLSVDVATTRRITVDAVVTVTHRGDDFPAEAQVSAVVE